ncbi:MAG: hypothetical protein HYX87_04770 [Chloroflexi bacterium]|nr:hypothetical protein [Chloroflexota bacterium]
MRQLQTGFRTQRACVEMMLRDLDSLVPEDHTVRAIWEYLQRLDPSGFYGFIKATLDKPGRPASDPQVLLGLRSDSGIPKARKTAAR